MILQDLVITRRLVIVALIALNHSKGSALARGAGLCGRPGTCGALSASALALESSAQLGRRIFVEQKYNAKNKKRYDHRCWILEKARNNPNDNEPKYNIGNNLAVASHD